MDTPHTFQYFWRSCMRRGYLQQRSVPVHRLASRTQATSHGKRLRPCCGTSTFPSLYKQSASDSVWHIQKDTQDSSTCLPVRNRREISRRRCAQLGVVALRIFPAPRRGQSDKRECSLRQHKKQVRRQTRYRAHSTARLTSLWGPRTTPHTREPPPQPRTAATSRNT